MGAYPLLFDFVGGGGASPLTTKGDLYTRNSSADARLPVGLPTQVLLADPSTATGLKWGSNTTPPASGYYGAFSDVTDQLAAAINTGYPMLLGVTDLTNGVTVVSGSRVTIANTGIYNIQWSGQFRNPDAAEHDVTVWLRKNGVDVPGSAGVISVPKKHGSLDGHILPSWNFLLDPVAGDYYEFVWSTTDTDVFISFEPAGSPPPSTASVVLTVTQQAGIMAGTGITAINSLTGSAQTLTVGTTGTDFAIVDSGVDHKFNLPTASALNRGALSSTDWSTFNGKLTSPLTTKGDLLTFSTVDAKLAIGANATIFMADSAATTGNKWIALSGDVTIATTGATTIKTSVALAGSPTTTTQPVATNDTTIATTAYVTTAIKTFSPYQRQNFWNRNTGGAFRIVYAAVNDVLYVANNSAGAIYCYNCVTGALMATIVYASPVGLFYLPLKGEVYATNTSNGTITRLSTAATPTTLGVILLSGSWGECLVEYSATKAFIGNLGANNVTVVNPTTNVTDATIAAITSPRGICLNSNVSSAQNDRLVVTGSAGVTIINPATNAVTAVASTVGGNLGASTAGIIYIDSQDLYVICDQTNNRLCWLTPATATTFTASYFTYSLNRCWSLAYDSTNQVILVVGANMTSGSTTIPSNTIVWVIDALTRVCLRTILTNSNWVSLVYSNNYISIKSPGVAIISAVGSTMSSEIIYA